MAKSEESSQALSQCVTSIANGFEALGWLLKFDQEKGLERKKSTSELKWI